MDYKLKGSVLVSSEGRITAFSGHAHLKQLLTPGCFLIDHVYLNDRVAILTYMDTLRQMGHVCPVSFRLQHRGGLIDNCVLGPGYTVTDGRLELAVEVAMAGADMLLPAHAGSNGLHRDIPPLAAVAHEMRTPLNAIIGFSDFLLHEAGACLEHASQREYVSLIKRSGEHLLEMITRALGGAECSGPGRSIHSDIAGIIQECAAMMSSLLCSRRMRICTGKTAVLHADASDIDVRQIVINLLSNAIKYTRDDGCITLATSVNGKGQLVISVTDDGIGISRRQLACIGMPFRRAGNALESSVEGNGLGLALVYKIAASYGGRVRIRSREGKGTDISVFLPLVEKNSSRKPSGRTDSFPHLIHVKEMENPDGIRDKITDNGKEENKIRKPA